MTPIHQQAKILYFRSLDDFKDRKPTTLVPPIRDFSVFDYLCVIHLQASVGPVLEHVLGQTVPGYQHSGRSARHRPDPQVSPA